ncbi:MAG TPA: hypothetical protein VLG69_00535 [Candidatus Andersenbacteria bacterium]|nr:hypothetical protein [Candidatus Andersenbacteria bacterium]
MAEENRKAIDLTGFTRIERDDRLLDVFPKETIEKGVELWEKWTDKEVEIIRIHDSKNITKHVFSREQVENALIKNQILLLK